MMEVDNERWQEAQEAERKCHDTLLRQNGEAYVKQHYKWAYSKYFDYLGIRDCKDKVIVEIGCADFPGLEWVTCKKGYLIEPLPSDILKGIVSENPQLELIPSKVEEIELPKSDEIWLLNVMQHVQDPDLFIEKCKESTKEIRFFEPIDEPIEVHHPHTFDFDWYKRHFPKAKKYERKDKNFHGATCAYGLWIGDI